MAGSELIINDEQISSMKRFFNNSIGGGGNSIEHDLTALLSELNKIRTTAIIQGQTADKLDVFIEYIGQLQGSAEGICEDIKSLIDAFLTAIDDADQFLF